MSMAPSFQTLRKNMFGRVAGAGVRHLLQTYFSRKHGWQIHGLEPHSTTLWNTSSHSRGVNVLQDNAPDLVQALFEDGGSAAERGLSLDDAAALAALVERLVMDNWLETLEAAYRLNDYDGIDRSKPLSLGAVQHVLTTYLLMVVQNVSESRVATPKLQKV